MKSFSLRRCNSLTAVWIAEEEESEVKLVQLIGVTGGGSLVCCICLVWWVHAFYRVLRKHFRTKAEEAREEEEKKERQVRPDRIFYPTTLPSPPPFV